MSDYRESSGFCPHCNRRVIGRREKTNDTFWLIATLFSCGLFGIIWFISSVIKSSRPRHCSICGTFLVPEVPASHNVQRPAFATGIDPSLPSRKKSLLPIVLTIFGVLFVVGLVITLALVAGFTADRQRTETAKALASKSPSTVTSVPTSTPKGAPKYRTKVERIKAGIIDIDQPYGLTCFRKLKEDFTVIGDDSIPKKAQVVLFERCLELEGDAETAMRELMSVLK